jgi:hypothetical protein
LRWGPQLGAVGAATGAIATGAAATSTSTTIIISIATTISTATTSTEARDKVIGNTTRNTGETLLTVTEEPRTSSVVRVRVERVIDPAPGAPGAPVGRVALAELAALVGRVALAELAVLVVREALAELAEPVDQEALAELAEPVVREALAELAEPVDQEAAKPERGPVAVELEHVPAAAERELVQVGVALRTKSVTAAHHRGQVLGLRVEDSAVAAETTREPAATEAEKAWAAVE